MAELKYKAFFCKYYGELANEVCPKLKSDDWCGDTCMTCCGSGSIETTVYEFDVKCLTDSEYGKKDEVVKAHVMCPTHFVVNGYMCCLTEFKEKFKII